jgi:serine protease Do
MSTRTSSFFYGTIIALAALVSGLVIASRLDLAPASLAGTLNVPATNSAPLAGAIDATTFRTIAHDQSPAVVSIITTGKRATPDISDFFPGVQPFNRRGGRGGDAPRQIVQGAGSGFIIDGKQGYILTNNHVVEDADDIRVMLAEMKNDEDALQARVVGRDKLTDSALIQLTEAPKQALPEVKFGDSSQLAAGDWVMAIGNPFQFANTVTVGVVSAVGRVSPELNPTVGRDLEYIQTDAAINRGNSGGPLLNIRGEVVGVNTAIISEQGGNIGIGFAVPINTVRDVLPQLRTGHVVRGRIGIGVSREPMTMSLARSYGLSAPTGAIVSSVEADSPARAAGLKEDDVILEFNGKAVKDSADLVGTVTRTTPGTSVPVKIMREGKPMSLTIKVGELNVEAENASVRDTSPRPGAGPDREPTDTGFGMSIEPVSARSSRVLPNARGGAVVADVEPGSAAYRGGVAPGDVILRINGKEVTSVDEVTKALNAVGSGETARVLVSRRTGNSTAQEQVLFLHKR